MISNSVVHASALHWKSVNLLSRLALICCLMRYDWSGNMDKIYSLPKVHSRFSLPVT